MTTDVPSPLVPKLRFPEFRITGDWKRDQIGNIASISKGKGVSKADIEKSGFTPCIRYAELYTHYGEVIREALSHTNVPPEDLVLSQAEDVIVPASGETRADIARAACVVPAGVALGGDLNILRSDLSGRFFSYLLNSPLRSKIARLAQGDTVAHLYPGQLSKVTISYPLPAEQQKIADCLGSLDDLIAADGRKLEALRQHKQGLMQQLFPQPGETRPRLRFPEFEDAPDWEEVTLGTLLDRPPDYGVNAAAVPFSESLPTYIRITDINDDGQFASRARVSVDIDATDEQYLEDGDIVLARTGASVGKSYRYREEDGRLVYAGFLIRVRPSPERLLSQFLAAYLSTWSYWDWVRLTSERSGQPGVNATEYASIPLPLPPDRRTLAEQQKIADCLTSIDDQLNAQARKLDTLKQHKQGLQQQLFPSLDGQ